MPKKLKKTNSKRHNTKLTKPNPFYKSLVSTQSASGKTNTPGSGPLSRAAKKKNR